MIARVRGMLGSTLLLCPIDDHMRTPSVASSRACGQTSQKWPAAFVAWVEVVTYHRLELKAGESLAPSRKRSSLGEITVTVRLSTHWGLEFRTRTTTFQQLPVLSQRRDWRSSRSKACSLSQIYHGASPVLTYVISQMF